MDIPMSIRDTFENFSNLMPDDFRHIQQNLLTYLVLALKLYTTLQVDGLHHTI